MHWAIDEQLSLSPGLSDVTSPHCSPGDACEGIIHQSRDQHVALIVFDA